MKTSKAVFSRISVLKYFRDNYGLLRFDKFMINKNYSQIFLNKDIA